jgi:glycerate 2-kinase
MCRFENYREDVMQLVTAALRAADPATAVTRYLRRDGRLLHSGDVHYDLDQGRVFLVSIGKAALPMARAAAGVLGADLFAGIVISKQTADALPAVPEDETPALPDALRCFTGGHPVSTPASVAATQAVIDLMAQTRAGDLALCLISGGASALFTAPLVDLADWQALTRALLASGCTIDEFNTVRRRLDRVKGGGLARLAAPARCLSLIMSDVVGNPLEAIGSGPTVLGDDPPGAARAVLARYDVETHLASADETAIWARINRALDAAPDEPPPAGVRSDHVIVGDVRQAALAALSQAVQLGFVSHLLTAHLEGEAREVGRVAAALAKDAPPGRCLILGGETTVTLRGDGRGGRNLETALAAALALDGRPHTAVASVATDGEDGPTDAAGAVVTGLTAGNGRGCGLDPHAYLARNDSYTFFRELDARAPDQPPALIQTGATGANVNDLLFILTYPAPAA